MGPFGEEEKAMRGYGAGGGGGAQVRLGLAVVVVVDEHQVGLWEALQHLVCWVSGVGFGCIWEGFGLEALGTHCCNGFRV